MRFLRPFVLVGCFVLGPFLDASPGASKESRALLFNHFYVVTDASTYRDAQASTFMTRDFAAFEKRTTVRNDTTYTGIYFYGRHTYFELFDPGAQGPEGSSGLAFGVETPGASAEVKALWAKAAGGAQGGPVTRRTETAEVPWFEMTYPQGGRPGTAMAPVLRLWLMEYASDFLARWYPDLTPARSISRADVLDRYVARIGQAGRRDAFLMKDVVALTLALPAGDRERLLAPLRAVGYAVREEKGTTVLEGPDLRLRLASPAGAERGVVEVEISLQSRSAPVKQRLGSAVLTVEADRAHLRFGAPAGVR